MEKKRLPGVPQWNESPVEHIKKNSNFLRGTLRESILDIATGALASDDTNLIKFHGSYQQTDRDLDAERKKQKLEPLYSFMIRARIAAGVTSAQQWLVFDHIADTYANGTLKLTTRQTFQWHGIFKHNLKKSIQQLHTVLVDSIAACGDVNRNVMATSNEALSPVAQELAEFARTISDHLLPRSHAYHEIWLDKVLVHGGEPEEEPIYGNSYLPRKFKIAIAAPPYNDTDVFANDIGLIAIVEKNRLAGYNVAAGGGMGMTFGLAETYPRLADILGYIPKAQALQVVEEIMKLQRDYGNRENRKLSRLKYTIDRLGPETFKALLEERLGFSLEPSRPYQFTQNGDVYGWNQAHNQLWYYGLFVENGRVKDAPGYALKTALREIAATGWCDFRLTGNQGLVLGRIKPDHKEEIEQLLRKHGVSNASLSGMRKNAIACVALPTCTMAFAEAERYLPTLLNKLDAILYEYDLTHDDILIRMTGCPNGCGRPFLGEIGLVGKSPGRYNLYLGASFLGDRLNTLYKETLTESEILAELSSLLETYSYQRKAGERFGDFAIRAGFVKPASEIADLSIHNPSGFSI